METNEERAKRIEHRKAQKALAKDMIEREKWARKEAKRA